MRLLCIRLGAMGDLLHASASLALLPADVEVHWLTSPMYQTLVSRLPRVDVAIPWDKKAGWLQYCRLIQQMPRYDAVINWHPSLKTWWLAKQVTKGPVFTYKKQKLPVAGEAVRSLARRHAVDDFAQPVYQWISATGQYVHPRPLVPVLPVPEPSPYPITPDHTHIGVIPGVGQKRGNRGLLLKDWRLVLETLYQLKSGALTFHLIGGPDEVALCDCLISQLDLNTRLAVVNHAARWHVLQTAALLKACDVVIGGDTGPTHLATAVGTGVISPFGPTDPRRSGPCGLEGQVTCLLPGNDLPCWPCEKPVCHLDKPHQLACLQPQYWLDELVSRVTFYLR